MLEVGWVVEGEVGSEGGLELQGILSYNIYIICDISPQKNDVIKILGWNVFFAFFKSYLETMKRPGSVNVGNEIILTLKK